MTTTKQYELRASAVRAAKTAGLKHGEFEVVQVRGDKGKSHWEFRATASAPVATEPAASGPTTPEPANVDDVPKCELVVVDYADQPKAEEPVTAPVATAPTSAPTGASRRTSRPSRTRRRRSGRSRTR